MAVVFENIISLGHMCNVASDLEQLGLRNASGPFDWLITESTAQILELIDNQFEGFLQEEELLQYSANRSQYRNQTHQIWFYHDFDGRTPLHAQMPQVQTKYRRRIERFYEMLKKPALLIRYVCRQADADYIAEHVSEITARLKRFNPENQIVYIANLDVELNIPCVYWVQPEDGHTAAEHPILGSTELTDYLMSGIFSETIRKKNLERYQNSMVEKTRYRRKATIRKILRKLHLLPEYHHSAVI